MIVELATRVDPGTELNRIAIVPALVDKEIESTQVDELGTWP